jgi:hypothetical protein
LVFCLFETESHYIPRVGLEITKWPRLSLLQLPKG